MIRCLVFIVVLVACSAPVKKSEKIASSSIHDISIAIFESEHGGYGYNIFVDKKLLIHQPHIPAIASDLGFPTTQSARNVADLVVKKVKANQMPPSLTVEEVREAMRFE